MSYKRKNGIFSQFTREGLVVIGTSLFAFLLIAVVIVLLIFMVVLKGP